MCGLSTERSTMAVVSDNSERTADRFGSPSRDSLDSGFDSSFPGSPDSLPIVVDDHPPALDRCSTIDPQTAPQTEDEDDGAPVAKMPRLEPMIADENQKTSLSTESSAAAATTTSSTVRSTSVPVVDEEPRPESASSQQQRRPLPKIWAKLPLKRVRLLLEREELDPYIQRLQPRHRCEWSKCGVEFFDINDLYDHAMEKHLETICPKEETPQQPPKGRTQRRASNGEADDERFRCQWTDCEMCLHRGTDSKKFDWLKSHFKARHAAKAQPIRCLFSHCPIRFQTEKALHSHLKNSHDDRPSRKAPPPPPPKPSVFNYRPRVRTQNYANYDFVDKRTMNWISERVDDLCEQMIEREDEEEAKENLMIVEETSNVMNTAETVAVLRQLFGKKFHVK